MAERGDIRIGISGWRYAPWRGVLYPKGLRQKDELSFAVHRFKSIGKRAAKHDDRMKDVALTPDAKRPMRHAIEIRHESFVDPDFIALLRDYKVALVCADTVEWPRLMDLSADFMYCRLYPVGR